LHLLARDGLLTPRIDRFEGDQVFAPDGGDLRNHHGLQPLPFADFDTHVSGQRLIRITAHGAQRFSDASFGKHAQEGRLREFDLQSFVQRIVENGVAGFVGEAGQQDHIGPGQHRPREKDTPGSERCNNDESRDTGCNQRAAFIPEPRRWHGGSNGRQRLFHDGQSGLWGAFDASDEAVATSWDSFDVAGFFGGIGQRIPQFLDRAVQAGIEVNKSVLRPKFLLQFLAGDQLAGTLQQDDQQLKGLVLKLNANTILVQFARTRVHLEGAEAYPGVLGNSFHIRLPIAGAVSLITIT
jgi:hypothetical protein